MVHIKNYINDLSRLDHILNVFFEEGFGDIIHRHNLHQRLRKKRKPQSLDSPEVRLRRAFERLGPTFIKLGQVLGSRPDLVPKKYAREFEKLQENAPQIPYSKIKQIVETELGDKIVNVFGKFEKKPLATASIAQVHCARLHTGQTIVVKVQKPMIREMIERDLDIMFVLAHMLDCFSGFQNYDVVTIVKEFASWTHRELDFSIEAKNIERFRYNLQEYEVIIPKVYQKLSTSRLLVMEFENGEHISKHKFSSDNERVRFVQNLVNVMCRMVFEDGFFHGDPHAGNVFITKGGRLILLDFGMVGTLDENLRTAVCEIFISLLDKDTKQVIEQILSITKKRETAQIATYKTQAGTIIQKWYDKPIGKCSIIMTFYDLVSAGAKNGIVFPADLVLLAKSFMNLEGIAVQIFPEANIQEVMKPYIEKIVMERYNPVTLMEKSIMEIKSNRELYANLPEHISELFRRIDKGEVNFHMDPAELDSVEGAISRSSERQALALIITVLLITSPVFFYLEIDFLGLNLGIFEIVVSLVLMIQLFIVMKKRKRYI